MMSAAMSSADCIWPSSSRASITSSGASGSSSVQPGGAAGVGARGADGRAPLASSRTQRQRHTWTGRRCLGGSVHGPQPAVPLAAWRQRSPELHSPAQRSAAQRSAALTGVVDAREVFNLPRPGRLVEALGVALLAHLRRGGCRGGGGGTAGLGAPRCAARQRRTLQPGARANSWSGCRGRSTRRSAAPQGTSPP